eukprot:5359974-Pleurochrysis_carterae.AAC.1
MVRERGTPAGSDKDRTSLLVPAPAQQASYHMRTDNNARESHALANAQHGHQHARFQVVFACAKQNNTT